VGGQLLHVSILNPSGLQEGVQEDDSCLIDGGLDAAGSRGQEVRPDHHIAFELLIHLYDVGFLIAGEIEFGVEHEERLLQEGEMF
jgi:hypothetical protein